MLANATYFISVTLSGRLQRGLWDPKPHINSHLPKMSRVLQRTLLSFKPHKVRKSRLGIVALRSGSHMKLAAVIEPIPTSSKAFDWLAWCFCSEFNLISTFYCYVAVFLHNNTTNLTAAILELPHRWPLQVCRQGPSCCKYMGKSSWLCHFQRQAVQQQAWPAASLQAPL